MKKFFLVLVAIAALAFVGCDKSSKDDLSNSDDLAGTTWVAFESYSDGWERETVSFLKNGKVTLLIEVEDEGKSDSILYSGTYLYDAPDITLHLSVYDFEHTFTGSIMGNQMHLYEKGQFDVTFTRK